MWDLKTEKMIEKMEIFQLEIIILLKKIFVSIIVIWVNVKFNNILLYCVMLKKNLKFTRENFNFNLKKKNNERTRNTKMER